MKIAAAIFLIAHGLVHAGLAFAPNPDDANSKPGAFFTAVERSWLLPRIGFTPAMIQWTGILLVVLTTFGFILVGIGLFGVAGLNSNWKTMAMVSAILSTVLLVLFWHPWLPVGVLINIGTIIATVR